MLQLRKSAILVLAACLACPALAADSAIQTSRYVFSSDKSTIVQTGGFAGVHWTYRIEGQFVLSVDPNAKTVSFNQVDANAADDNPYLRTLDPNEVFAMTSLTGRVVNDTTLEFTGLTANNSTVRVTATLADGSMHMVASTTPPPNSADFFVFAMDAVAQRKYAGGTGEVGAPYQIATATDLIALGEEPNDYDKHFLLTADIDLDPNLPGRKVFDKAVIAPDTDPVKTGVQGTPFTGTFDGRGCVIRHLTITGGDYLGLFGQLGMAAEVKGFGILDVNLTGSGICAGAMIGVSTYGSVSQCYSTGTISGGRYVGGLIGGISNKTVTQCYSAAVVRGDSYVGGLLGGVSIFPASDRATVTRCYSTGDVSGRDCVGGLMGVNQNGTVAECFSIAKVNGATYAGGLVGDGRSGIVDTSFWCQETSGQMYTSGGGKGVPTRELMQTASTFDAWAVCGHEDIWTIDEGNDYPRLWWEHRRGRPLTKLCDRVQGVGTKDAPYLIYTPEELNLIGRYPGEWNKHFKLMADVNMADFDGKNGRPTFNVIAPNLGGPYTRETHKLAPMTFPGTSFTGVFDGNDHAIRHLTIKDARGGLFGGLWTEAEVKRLGVVDVNISGSVYGLGGLAGWNCGMISQCYSTGVVCGQLHIGGLVGVNQYGTVSQSYSTCSVRGDSYVGGLVADNWQGKVTQSRSGGVVIGDSYIGGLAGWNWGTVTQSYSHSTASGLSYTGGLIGGTSYSTIAQCYCSGTISGGSGPVGYWLGTTPSNCFCDTQTSGQSWMPGWTGETTAEMRMARTFTDAGWDFVGETTNGAEDIWWINEGKDYPRLWWEAK